MRFFLVALALIAAGLAGGCSLVAPKYTASLENVQKLKDAGDYRVRVGSFTSEPGAGNANPISMRGSRLASPYGGTYSEYLAEAIKQELSLAGRLAPEADLEVSGVLTKNDINVGGFVTGYGDIGARFMLKRAGQIRYDSVKTAHTEWDSSFVAAIALPRGQEEYPRLVQRLLESLYADPSFMEALK